MPLKDILVHIESTPRATEVLRLAASLARRHDAHLIGLHVVDIVLPPFAMAGGVGGSAAMLGDMMDQLREQALAAAQPLEAAFSDLVRRDGLKGEWRQVEGPLPELVALHARYADLAVIGQPDPGNGQPGAELVAEQVLFSAGRPVLLVPRVGHFEDPGRRILVGWNASREAARAVNDALPVLCAAEAVTVLAVNPDRLPGAHGAEPGADIALHLARHGVTAQAEKVSAPGTPDAEALLNRASELAADLLVMGAYGHSRLREMILGGVTRRLLQSMTVPVLMSH